MLFVTTSEITCPFLIGVCASAGKSTQNVRFIFRNEDKANAVQSSRMAGSRAECHPYFRSATVIRDDNLKAL